MVKQTAARRCKSRPSLTTLARLPSCNGAAGSSPICVQHANQQPQVCLLNHCYCCCVDAAAAACLRSAFAAAAACAAVACCRRER